MSDVRRNKYERLLRWYPKAWREEHGRLMLDTLDEHATDRGGIRSSIAEAWSIRAHGLGERATNRWAIVAASLSLAAFFLATATLLSNALLFPGAGALRTVLAVFVGPLALAIAVIVLLYRRDQLSAPASLYMAVGAVPAWALAALAAASLTIAFDEGDAGTGRTWFGSATLLFILMAWLVGAASLFVPVASMVNKKLPAPIRWLLVVVLAAVLALAYGVFAVMGQMMGSLAAAAVLVLAVLAGRPSRSMLRAASIQAVEPSVPAARPATLTRGTWTKVGAAALFSFAVGIGCAAFALTGSMWAPGVTDSTHAMNLGLAPGALVAIPVAVAGAMILAPRFGKIMRWSALLLCMALAVEAAAQLAGAGHPLQWPLTVAAGVMLSLAFALPISRLVSTKPAVRIGVAVALGLAGSMPGLMVVSAAAFIAPVVAAVLAVWAWRRLSDGRRNAIPHVAYPL